MLSLKKWQGNKKEVAKRWGVFSNTFEFYTVMWRKIYTYKLTHHKSLKSSCLAENWYNSSSTMELQKTPTSLVFAVNGERFELSHVDPSTTLLHFLRTRTRFKSVKLGCGEGIYIYIYLCIHIWFYVFDNLCFFFVFQWFSWKLLCPCRMHGVSVFAVVYSLFLLTVNI